RHWSLPVYSLMAGSRLDQAIRNAIPPELQIEDLALPCAGVAADLVTGDEVVLQRGSAWLSARACAGIPGVFPPTPLDGKLLVDGGVISPVPCGTAREMGADIVLGISLEVAAPRAAPDGGSVRSAVDLRGRRRGPTWPVALLRSLDLLQHGLTRHCLE